MRLKTEARILDIYNKVWSFLSSQGIKAYLVGGFIRDNLLGIKSADIDFAIRADTLKITPLLAQELGGKYVLLDEQNRITRVVLKGEAKSAQLYLDFSSFEGDIREDLARRDFTIDAMAVELEELKEGGEIEIVDPFGGLKDLKERVIRATGEGVFKEDKSRLLRAARLAAELKFKIEPRTEELIKENAHLISEVPGERVREELLRLFNLPEAGDFTFYLDELGILTSLIPELKEGKGVEQPKEHYWDVFEHSVRTVLAASFLLRERAWEYDSGDILTYVPWSEELARHFEEEVTNISNRKSLLKLAALLHDIAKPETKTIEENGRIRFLGHANVGAERAADILKRLRFSSKEIELVRLMVAHHLRPGQLSQEGMPSNRAIYRYFRDVAEASIDTLFLSLADHLASRGPNLLASHWQRHAQVVEYVLAQYFKEKSVSSPPKLISGDDLINIFGLSPGPRIGKILEAVREAQAAGEITTREEALAYAKNLLSEES